MIKEIDVAAAVVVWSGRVGSDDGIGVFVDVGDDGVCCFGMSSVGDGVSWALAVVLALELGRLLIERLVEMDVSATSFGVAVVGLLRLRRAFPARVKNANGSTGFFSCTVAVSVVAAVAAVAFGS